MRDLSRDVQLDKLHLDAAAQEQAALYFHYSSESAEARARRDRCDNRLRLRRAEIDLNLRKNPPEGVKVTEASIAALVIADPEVQELEEALVVAERDLAVADGAVRAMDHRKSSIDNLVRLHLAGYYGDPAGNGGTDASVAAQRGALNRKQNA